MNTKKMSALLMTATLSLNLVACGTSKTEPSVSSESKSVVESEAVVDAEPTVEPETVVDAEPVVEPEKIVEIEKPVEQSQPVKQEKPVEKETVTEQHLDNTNNKQLEITPENTEDVPSQTQQQEAQKKQEEQKAEQTKQEVSTKFSYPAGATTDGLTANRINKGHYILGNKVFDQNGKQCGWAPNAGAGSKVTGERAEQMIKETGEQYDGSGLYSDTSGFTG